jgi:hypothetical protein
MNAVAGLLLENRRIDSRPATMDAAAEALQALGDPPTPPDPSGKAPPPDAAGSEPVAGTEEDTDPAAVDKKQEEPDAAEKPEDPTKEEETESKEGAEAKGEDGGKRYLPEHKKPDAAPTFPEKVRTAEEALSVASGTRATA